MSQIIFPVSPTIGQQYVQNGSAWTWDGVKWIKTAPELLQVPTASYVDITGSGVLVNYGLDGQIQLTASAGDLTEFYTYSASLNAWTSSAYTGSVDQFLLTASFDTYTGSNASQFAGTASYALTASYVNLLAGPNITINYQADGIAITGSGGGGAQNLQNVTTLGNSTTASIFISASLTNGDDVSVFGTFTHAEGRSTTAKGNWSHAEGETTIASGSASHAEGQNTTTIGNYSHAEGASTKALGNFSHAEGNLSTALGIYSHAEGSQTKAIAPFSHAEGFSTETNGTGSRTEGGQTVTGPAASYAHAEGFQSTALGTFAHAEGYQATAVGFGSHAEGGNALTVTDGGTALGNGSHAEGGLTLAIGNMSHAEGYQVSSSGDYSHAEGYQTTAIGIASHTEGLGTISNGDYQTVVGQYNTTFDTASAFVVGTGTNNASRQNGLVVYYNPLLLANIVLMPNLPTSAVGLPSGAIWNNLGVLNIAP